MKVGDIVNFHCAASVFEASNEAYKDRNPGVIIETDDSHRQMRFTILWANKEITNEHIAYLAKPGREHEVSER